MSKRTVTNESYRGIVESLSIPAEVVEREGKKFAMFGDAVPIHCCTASEGDGGYFDTNREWKSLDIPEGALIYGKRAFTTRDELRAFVETLPEGISGPLTPVLWRGSNPRITLTMDNGRQVAHHYLSGVNTSGIEYL